MFSSSLSPFCAAPVLEVRRSEIDSIASLVDEPLFIRGSFAPFFTALNHLGNNQFNQKSQDGRGLIHLVMDAVMQKKRFKQKHVDLIEELLEEGVKPCLEDKFGNNYWHYFFNNYLEDEDHLPLLRSMIDLFIKKGVPLFVRNQDGKLPFDLLAERIMPQGIFFEFQLVLHLFLKSDDTHLNDWDKLLKICRTCIKLHNEDRVYIASQCMRLDFADREKILVLNRIFGLLPFDAALKTNEFQNDLEGAALMRWLLINGHISGNEVALWFASKRYSSISHLAKGFSEGIGNPPFAFDREQFSTQLEENPSDRSRQKLKTLFL